jgi:hypothetical protein
MTAPGEATDDVVEIPEEATAVEDVEVDALTAIPAGGHVVDPAGHMGAKRTRHDA